MEKTLKKVYLYIPNLKVNEYDLVLGELCVINTSFGHVDYSEGRLYCISELYDIRTAEKVCRDIIKAVNKNSKINKDVQFVVVLFSESVHSDHPINSKEIYTNKKDLLYNFLTERSGSASRYAVVNVSGNKKPVPVSKCDSDERLYTAIMGSFNRSNGSFKYYNEYSMNALLVKLKLLQPEDLEDLAFNDDKLKLKVVDRPLHLFKQEEENE